MKNSNTVWNQRIGHGKAKQILLLLQLARFPDFAHKNLFVSVWKIMDNGCASFSNKKTWLLFDVFFSVKSIVIFFLLIYVWTLQKHKYLPTLQSTCSILVQLFVKKSSLFWSCKDVTTNISSFFPLNSSGCVHYLSNDWSMIKFEATIIILLKPQKMIQAWARSHRSGASSR